MRRKASPASALEPIEIALRQAPELFGPLRPQAAAGSVVGRRAAAQREAAVASARTPRDLTSLVDADVPARLREREGA